MHKTRRPNALFPPAPVRNAVDLSVRASYNVAMRTRRLRTTAWFWCTCLAALLASSARAEEPPRAIVADLSNVSRDRHTIVARTATDTLIRELTRSGVYTVLSPTEIDRAAKARGLRPPYSEQDLDSIAKELDVPLIVTGEISFVDSRVRSKQREVEGGVIVRVKSRALGELVNGAAERAVATDAADGSKSEGELLIEAAGSAATRAVNRIAAYRPIEGTILNSAGQGLVILNRGAGSGVRSRQEFLIFRNGALVGRARVFKVYPAYTELTVLDRSGGVAPQDRALSIFPEPKFGR